MTFEIIYWIQLFNSVYVLDKSPRPRTRARITMLNIPNVDNNTYPHPCASCFSHKKKKLCRTLLILW